MPQPPAPVPAMLFLYRRTAANRLRQQVARAKSPRYLAAVVMGMLYIWWALFRNAQFGSGPLAKLVETDIAVPIASAFLLLSAARWWLFGGERSALAFSQAEVQFLFPAPVSRRQLVHAKLMRMQLAILLNTLIFSVLLRGGGGSVEGWQRGLSLWMLFSTLALHRLGASIVHANAMEHVGTARRRLIVPLLVFGAVLAAVIFGVVTAWPLLRVASLSGVKAVLLAITDALRATVPAAALWPVRAVLEPVFLGGGTKWLAAMPWAVMILSLHYLWVVRLDKAFEEAALEATQHRAERQRRLRASQMGNSRSRKGKLATVPSLALTGRPEMAIAWKNVVAALRGGAWRTQLLTFTIGLAALAAVTRSASDRAGDVFMGVTFAWGAMLLFIGPLWMRFDLRLDLPRLAMLKTMPLPGWRIVAAEIAAVTALHDVRFAHTSAVLIATCDMPTVTVEHLQSLLAMSQQGTQRVASEYSGPDGAPVRGIPATLPRADWPALAALDGDQGARGLLRDIGTLTVSLPSGHFDLDTPSDIAAWRTTGPPPTP